MGGKGNYPPKKKEVFFFFFFNFFMTQNYEDEGEREIHQKNRSASGISGERTPNSNLFMQ
jgi:hypothetical protein